jgi:hypothetical protein
MNCAHFLVDEEREWDNKDKEKPIDSRFRI